MAWVLTLAHRRAVDRVRSSQASSDREQRVPYLEREHDQVAEEVETRLDRDGSAAASAASPSCNASPTLAYYSGYTYPEVAGLLRRAAGHHQDPHARCPHRMRDCLGVDR